MPRFQNYGERKGGLAAELWKLLQELGGFDRPMYKGTDWVVNGRSHRVLCRLTIYARRDTKARRPLNISVQRMVFLEGIQESSRLAILRICNIYARKLHDTVFRYHPRASAVDLPARYPSTDGERNATVVNLAQFAASQAESLELAAIELECVYVTLQITEERIATLEEALYGQHEHKEHHQEEVQEEAVELVEPEALEEPAVPTRMPAQFQVYSRREHRRGCGGYLID